MFSTWVAEQQGGDGMMILDAEHFFETDEAACENAAMKWLDHRHGAGARLHRMGEREADWR